MSDDSSGTNPALFSTFVMGLASAALIELGVVDDPQTKKKRHNRLLAKQHIDYLQMLKDKTKGNLDDNENKLIDSVLTDLKLHFVKASEEAPPKK